MTWINFFAAIGVFSVSVVFLAILLVWLVPESIAEIDCD
jgi:hypothetical protein